MGLEAAIEACSVLAAMGVALTLGYVVGVLASRRSG